LGTKDSRLRQALTEANYQRLRADALVVELCAARESLREIQEMMEETTALVEAITEGIGPTNGGTRIAAMGATTLRLVEGP